MKIGKFVALAAFASVVPLSTARAQSSYCYPGQLWTCFSMSVQTWDRGDGTDVVLSVRNTSTIPAGGQASWITAFAFSAPSDIGSASGLAVAGDGSVQVVGNPGAEWSFLEHDIGFGQLGLVTTTSYPNPKTGAIIGCGSVAGGQTAYFNTCAPSFPGFVTFSFHTSGDWIADEAVVLAKFQTEWDSFECATGPAGNMRNCTPTNVVPEPVTMLLLGTGLAGMGGAGLVRRRKKNGDIENA